MQVFKSLIAAVVFMLTLDTGMVAAQKPQVTVPRAVATVNELTAFVKSLDSDIETRTSNLWVQELRTNFGLHVPASTSRYLSMPLEGVKANLESKGQQWVSDDRLKTSHKYPMMIKEVVMNRYQRDITGECLRLPDNQWLRDPTYNVIYGDNPYNSMDYYDLIQEYA